MMGYGKATGDERGIYFPPSPYVKCHLSPWLQLIAKWGALYIMMRYYSVYYYLSSCLTLL